MRESPRMKKTDEGAQKFEFPEQFLHCGKKSARRAENTQNATETIRPLVSEKAQGICPPGTRTIIAAFHRRKRGTGCILNAG